MLLQSFDYLTLHREHGVTLQFGGSDQWGNITGGAELIRRTTGGTAHGFATPLVTKADGTKYGKTEDGALWLDPEMMSPYAFHQFWLNVEDEKVGELLRIFTFLSVDEIEELEARHREQPFRREAQRTLADAVTTFVHGADETAQATAAAAALFGGADLSELSESTLAAALREAGSARVDASGGVPCVVDLLVASGLASRARGRPGAPWATAAPTSTTSGSPTPTTSPAAATCCRVAGWSCGAARSSSPGSRSSACRDRRALAGRRRRACPRRPARPRAPLLRRGRPRRGHRR